MLIGAVTANEPRRGLPPDAYDAGWESWGDMIRYSPAPWHRRRLITQLAGSVPFASALDVGCGNGETLSALANRFDCELWGVDLSSAVIGRNRERLSCIEFRRLDVESRAVREAVENHGFRFVAFRRWGFPFHSTYKIATNLHPERTLRSFAEGEYHATQRAIGLLTRKLFCLNLTGARRPLVALARAT